MLLPLIAVFSAGILMVATWDYQDAARVPVGEQAAPMADADREVAAYQTFLMTAEAVMPHMPFVGAAVQQRSWAQLRSHAAAPSFARHAEMPSGWVVRGNDSGWVVCAPMSEHAARRLAGYVPQALGEHRTAVAHSGGQRLVIIGEKHAARHSTYVSWCS